MSQRSAIDAPDHICFRSKPASRKIASGVDEHLRCDPDETRCPRCIWDRWQESTRQWQIAFETWEAEVTRLKYLLQAAKRYVPDGFLADDIRHAIGGA